MTSFPHPLRHPDVIFVPEQLLSLRSGTVPSLARDTAAANRSQSSLEILVAPEICVLLCQDGFLPGGFFLLGADVQFSFRDVALLGRELRAVPRINYSEVQAVFPEETSRALGGGRMALLGQASTAGRRVGWRRCLPSRINGRALSSLERSTGESSDPVLVRGSDCLGSSLERGVMSPCSPELGIEGAGGWAHPGHWAPRFCRNPELRHSLVWYR